MKNYGETVYCRRYVSKEIVWFLSVRPSGRLENFYFKAIALSDITGAKRPIYIYIYIGIGGLVLFICYALNALEIDLRFYSSSKCKLGNYLESVTS